MLIALPPPQLVEISGADAPAFAQAQFSSDVTTLETGCWQWSAWLNAQGRVRAFFHLLRVREDSLWLLLRGGDATRLRDALARYVLRAKVAIRVVDAMRAYTVLDSSAVANLSGATDTRLIMPAGEGQACLALPGEPRQWLLLAPASNAPEADESHEARNRAALADIDAGIVSLAPALDEKLLPHWLGLDALGATSVRKGCYPGQEVVARLHFKGGVKRALYRIDIRSASLPEAGANIVAAGMGNDAGTVIAAAWREPALATALAVLHDDPVGSGHALLVGSARIESFSRAAPAQDMRLPK